MRFLLSVLVVALLIAAGSCRRSSPEAGRSLDSFIAAFEVGMSDELILSNWDGLDWDQLMIITPYQDSDAIATKCAIRGVPPDPSSISIMDNIVVFVFAKEGKFVDSFPSSRGAVDFESLKQDCIPRESAKFGRRSDRKVAPLPAAATPRPPRAEDDRGASLLPVLFGDSPSTTTLKVDVLRVLAADDITTYTVHMLSRAGFPNLEPARRSVDQETCLVGVFSPWTGLAHRLVRQDSLFDEGSDFHTSLEQIAARLYDTGDTRMPVVDGSTWFIEFLGPDASERSIYIISDVFTIQEDEEIARFLKRIEGRDAPAAAE